MDANAHRLQTSEVVLLRHADPFRDRMFLADVEAILDFAVSDTTLQLRRSQWINADVFTELEQPARQAYDRIIGLDLDIVAIDSSLHKAPCVVGGTGPNPTDRARVGWKWSIGSHTSGIPVGWAVDEANRNDGKTLVPTLGSIAGNGLFDDIGALSLDRSYDYTKIGRELNARNLFDLDIQQRETKPEPGTPHRLTLGCRWIVEATNTWRSNYGQLRRNTDGRIRHRRAALQLATAVIIVGRLFDYRNRWSPT